MVMNSFKRTLCAYSVTMYMHTSGSVFGSHSANKLKPVGHGGLPYSLLYPYNAHEVRIILHIQFGKGLNWKSPHPWRPMAHGYLLHLYDSLL